MSDYEQDEMQSFIEEPKNDSVERNHYTFENRPRGTLEQVQSYIEASVGGAVPHIVDNQDGTYSVVSHINCEYCDYCLEESHGQTHHIAKENIYEHVSPMISEEVTNDFCSAFPDKESCKGIVARLAITVLPKGVDPNDAGVKQIIEWAKENQNG
jgi:hypothetical protein